MGKDIRRLTKTTARKVLGEKNTKKIKTLIGRTSSSDTHASKKSDYGDNTVINHPKLKNSKIIFVGKNNILFCEEDVTLVDSKIMFCRSNSVIYISGGSKSRHTSLNIAVSHNSAVYIGKETNFHASKAFKTHIIAQEQKHVVIGDDCIFSLNCWLRTSDAHAAYDTESGKRLNLGKSIFIGDHVWIGQDVTILKGTKIGSGSIIGAGSVVPGKSIESNASYAGNPAKLVKDHLFFDRADMNHASRETTEYPDTDYSQWIYSRDNQLTLSQQQIDEDLTKAATSEEKLTYIQKHFVKNKTKNRFHIGQAKERET